MENLDFSENKILRVTPGRLTTYINCCEWDGLSSNVRKSFASTSTHLASTIPAKLKLYINQVKLSKSCLKYIREKIKGDIFIKVKWNFLDFEDEITSPERLDNNRAKFTHTRKYDLELEEDFLQKLSDSPLCFFLFAVGKKEDSKEESEEEQQNESMEEVFLSQQQYFIENLVEMVNVRNEVRVLFSSDLIETSAENIALLDMWYKFGCKQKNLRSLFAHVLVPTRSRKSEMRLSMMMDERVLHMGRSLGTVQVTDSEIDHFADGLLLVLNRNKVLKTTQSDISTELEERVRWLQFEANWKQTLQENAILHGRDPREVLWRQWREEDTANVRLRTYHHQKPRDYEPQLSITVVKLIFFEGSAPIKNHSVQKIFVAYSFLGFDGPEMETPFSLPKPPPNEAIVFNFKRTFRIDIQKNRDRCRMLADLIKNDEKIRFMVSSKRFMVINEPVECLEKPIQTCNEIGYAEVLINELIQLEDNTDSFEYEIVDIKNPMNVVGYLTVKVEGILAMRKMALTIMAPKDYDLFM